MLHMKKIEVFFLMMICYSLIIGCSSIREITNELRGTSKPSGYIKEVIPPTKSFSASHKRIWIASQEILDEWGYLYEANQSSSRIKTEPRYLNDTSKFRFIGSDYAAKLYITVKGSKVTFKARFNKKSNLVQGGDNLEYPEKENELRKSFFESLSKKLSA